MTQQLPRKARTKPIASAKEVQWEIVYAEPSELATKALNEAYAILYNFGLQNNFFQQTP